MLFLKSKTNCYCAFCRTPRRMYLKKNIGFLNVMYSFTAALVVMYAFWQEFDPRFLVIFAVFLGVTETFIQIRWRLSVFCKQCGFDPILYVKNPEAAADKVSAHLQKRRDDPKFLLAKPLNLPTITPEKSQALQNRDKKGSLVSRQA
ncbi:hypothetical protein [Bdellovibrio sp. HCB337]|uniref:hypothetical protein n=1 Tax=Bdellovibrio sp. HCB337 TaxID=3394358 RepID=UPI0039A42B74